AVVHKRALAVVAPGLAAIAHIHLATAMTTAQKPSQQQLAAPHRPSRQGAFAGRIISNDTLVPLEFASGDVARVLILEQHIPFRLRAPQSAFDALAAVLDAYLAHRAPKGIRSSIDGVGQNVVHGVVKRRLPDDAAALRRLMRFDGQGDALVTQPDVDLTNALEFSKFGKHQI